MTAYDRRALVFFVVFVAVLGLFAWRIEAQQRELEAYQYVSCLSRAENVRRLNAQSAAFIEIEQHNPYRFTSPETIERRIEIYRAATLDVPTCEDLKP